MDIRGLIEHPSRLAIVAQPVVDLRRGEIAGYEALSRFEVEPRATPDRVFAEATRQGIGHELEASVVRRVLALAKQKPPNCFLALNVDPGHLLRPEVQAAFAEADSLAGIVLELTEHREIEDMGLLTRCLDAHRRQGAFIAVDDAGSGYSGLQQILELRPQILKVDRALITNLHDDDAKRALVQMLGELAARLDAWLLAEGVETESELAVLRQLRVPLAQGYFFAKPGPPWADVLPGPRELMVTLPPSLRRVRVVHHVLEPCSTCTREETWPAVNLAVRVNDERRPIGMRFVKADIESLREEHELLRVKAEMTLASVAQRAATRPERVRWDPVVCIDDRGHFRGIVRMSRLVCALAETEEPSAQR